MPYDTMPREEQQTTGARAVVVTDVSIPFIDLVFLLVKLALAAVPATIILAVIWATIAGAVVGYFAGAPL